MAEAVHPIVLTAIYVWWGCSTLPRASSLRRHPTGGSISSDLPPLQTRGGHNMLSRFIAHPLFDGLARIVSRDQARGQGLAEYALILALIAIVAIVALIF